MWEVSCCLFKKQTGAQSQIHERHRNEQWKQKLSCQFQAQQPNGLYLHHLQKSFLHLNHLPSSNHHFLHLKSKTWISHTMMRMMTSLLPFFSLPLSLWYFIFSFSFSCFWWWYDVRLCVKSLKNSLLMWDFLYYKTRSLCFFFLKGFLRTKWCLVVWSSMGWSGCIYRASHVMRSLLFFFLCIL